MISVKMHIGFYVLIQMAFFTLWFLHDFTLWFLRDYKLWFLDGYKRIEFPWYAPLFASVLMCSIIEVFGWAIYFFFFT